MANVMSDLDRCRRLAEHAKRRAELARDDQPRGTRAHYDAQAVLEDVVDIHRLLGRIEAGLAPQAAAAPTGTPAANGQAQAARPAGPPAREPSGAVKGCDCLSCTATRVAQEVARRRAAGAAERPHLNGSAVGHTSSVATARDCAAKGCEVCLDALAAFGVGEDGPVVDRVTVGAILFGGLTPGQVEDATNGRR